MSIKRLFTRRWRLISYSTAFLISFLFLSAFIPSDSYKQEGQQQNTAEKVQGISQQDQKIIPTSAPNNPNIKLYKVTRIIDGDTIEIEGGRRVRYIGIDTPELGQNADCYATEAYEKNRELVGGGTVGLEKDVSETDRYGRLLRYVYMGDLLINDVLVRQGYAHASSYPPDIKYQDQFRQAEREARENSLGLWSSCNVQGSSTSRPATQSNSKDTNYAPAQPFQDPVFSCQYSCTSPDRDCKDFSTHAQAQLFFDCCGFSASYDPMRLDNARGQGDGIACESLP